VFDFGLWARGRSSGAWGSTVGFEFHRKPSKKLDVEAAAKEITRKVTVLIANFVRAISVARLRCLRSASSQHHR